MSRHSGKSSHLSVWFYTGTLLLIYGVLLLGTGIYQLRNPPQTVLASYHPTLWGGCVLLLLGTVYVVVYWPRTK
ncbi:MAG: hypothetical protein JO182_30515 [Acidobacteriaceae bacterium]|nr:hypothetical protein [Acidobacteriaceae bacterium]MBV9038858.1 hypothetical protein [Acidobacteriaceae bacterium]MBV9225674.1 hypothetical protein [Acidobacteriaceae bacterium]MBV9307062.1 hypothetical protein [Acidobacteriaceae bacterium]MBV9675077.1 hypothetical protein [Acidobacteriaceae bacterium]